MVVMPTFDGHRSMRADTCTPSLDPCCRRVARAAGQSGPRPLSAYGGKQQHGAVSSGAWLPRRKGRRGRMYSLFQIGASFDEHVSELSAVAPETVGHVGEVVCGEPFSE